MTKRNGIEGIGKKAASGKESERLLNGLLNVCLYSGYRGEGIGKAMDENREFLEVLLGRGIEHHRRPPACESFPWMEPIIQRHDLFFESLLAALRPSFPDAGRGPLAGPDFPRIWRGRYYVDEILWSTIWMERTGMRITDPEDLRECCDRVMGVVVPWLPGRLEENRRLREFVVRYPDAVCQGAGGWLENIDFFFLDVWDVLELDTISKDKQAQSRHLSLWRIVEEQHRQNWLELRARRVDAADRNIAGGMQEGKPVPHESEAK